MDIYCLQKARCSYSSGIIKLPCWRVWDPLGHKKINMAISFVHPLPVRVLLPSINCPEPGWNVLSLECQLQQKVMMLMLTNQMQLRVLSYTWLDIRGILVILVIPVFPGILVIPLTAVILYPRHLSNSSHPGHPSLACKQALRGALAVGREKEGVSGIWIPPPIPLWLSVERAVRFPSSARSGNKPECKQTLKDMFQG